MNEFELIQHYFTQSSASRSDLLVGIGDDAAVMRVPAGYDCIHTCDTLVAGAHFQLDVPPKTLGHKALAVNLSDCAAMGAEPAWISLALTLPVINENLDAWV